VGSWPVIFVYDNRFENLEEKISKQERVRNSSGWLVVSDKYQAMRKIYFAHGWPNVDSFDREGCQNALVKWYDEDRLS
jgi:hypothetical protein